MPKRMRYRFLTQVLAGPWRQTAAEAVADAIDAGQAVKIDEGGEGFRWLVIGAIQAADPNDVRTRNGRVRSLNEGRRG